MPTCNVSLYVESELKMCVCLYILKKITAKQKKDYYSIEIVYWSIFSCCNRKSESEECIKKRGLFSSQS